MARDRVATARGSAGAERHGYGALRRGGRGKMGAAARRAGEDGRCGAGLAAFLEKGLAKNLQNPLRRSVCFRVFAGAGYRKRRRKPGTDAGGSRKSQAEKRPPPPRAGRRARKAGRDPDTEGCRRRQVLRPAARKASYAFGWLFRQERGNAWQRSPLHRFAGRNAAVQDRVATARGSAGAERHGYGALSHGGRGKMGAAARGLRPFCKKAWRKTFRLRCGGVFVS